MALEVGAAERPKFGMLGLSFLDRGAEGECRGVPIVAESRLFLAAPLKVARTTNMPYDTFSENT